jgi:hypothetical protein
MNNLLPYCWLVDSRISASEKDLPVTPMFIHQNTKKATFLGKQPWVTMINIPF